MNLPKAGTSIPKNRFPESYLHMILQSNHRKSLYSAMFPLPLQLLPYDRLPTQVLLFHLGEELRISFYSGLAYGVWGGMGK